MSKNVELLSASDPSFLINGDIQVPIVGNFLWLTADIDEETCVGAICRAYDRDGTSDPALEIASVIVVDATSDPDEPDISTVHADDVPQLDTYLRHAVSVQLQNDGMQIVKWMSSQLNETAATKGLVTAYIVSDEGRERQMIALRLAHWDRKIVVIGSFDIARKDDVAAPIFRMMQKITVGSPRK